MPHKVKVSGSWVDAIPCLKVGGTWRAAKAIYNKVDGKWKPSLLQGAMNDLDFAEYDVSNGFSSSINSVLIQPDGKIVVSGPFATKDGKTVNGIVRMNPDGTTDLDFAKNTAAAVGVNVSFSNIKSMALQPDGKILVCGSFSSWNGVSKNRILRLNADGTVDSSFTASLSSYGFTIALQSDGKILVGGEMSILNSSTNRNIVRLNQDGSVDTSFVANLGTGANGSAFKIAVQQDGKILVGGAFTTWNGTSVNRFVRLNTDGTLDTSFISNLGSAANNSVENIAIQSDNKIVVCGTFTSWGGIARNRLLRLNADGTQDTAFNSNATGVNASLYGLAIQSDGKIIFSGNPTAWLPSYSTLGRILRLNADGTLDTSFQANIGEGPGVSTTIAAIALDANGKIVAGGDFIQWNSVPAASIIRFNSDGTHDQSLDVRPEGINGVPEKVVTQPDGKLLVCGRFSHFGSTPAGGIVRLNTNGTLDTAFAANVGTGTVYGERVRAVGVQSDGKILLGGYFWGWNGTTYSPPYSLYRLNSNGSFDSAFLANVPASSNNTIYFIKVQPDNKIIIAGQITTWGGTTINRIARLNANGSLDTAFQTALGTGPNNTIEVLILQPDGKIIVGGQFKTWSGNTANGLIRLNANGSVDTTFLANIGTAAGAAGIVYGAALAPDGSIYAGGSFTTWNSVTRNRIVKLNADGTTNTTFSTNSGTATNNAVSELVVQNNGQVLIYGGFASWNGSTAIQKFARINADGTVDTAFSKNMQDTLLTNSSHIYDMVIASDTRALFVGLFRAYNGVNRSGITSISIEPTFAL